VAACASSQRSSDLLPFRSLSLSEIRDDWSLFLRVNDIETEFEDSHLDKERLLSIAEHFEQARPEYVAVADRFHKEINEFEYVHSVAFRIKKTDSLIRKIIVKSLDGLEDIEPITEDNYQVLITDLVGLRILYVFKSEYLPVHKQIMKLYQDRTTEDIQINIKAGDDKNFYKGISRSKSTKSKFIENADYRSIHYIIKSAEKDKCPRVEIQTRTLFEEAWSEINHKIVYKNSQIAGFDSLSMASRILSSLAGGCDDLGDYMKVIYDNYTKEIAASINSSSNTSFEPQLYQEDDDLASRVMHEVLGRLFTYK